MSRLARIPDRGDMAPGAVQQRFGILLADFDELERRGFPERDPERADTASKPRTDGGATLSAPVSRVDGNSHSGRCSHRRRGQLADYSCIF